jgi:hypothetical protein
LPLVDEYRAITPGQAGRFGRGDDPLRLVVETVDGSCPLQGGGSLPDRAWPLDRYGWQTCEKLIEFVINDTSLVTSTWSAACSLFHVTTIPLSQALLYHFSDVYCAVSRCGQA